MSDQQDERDVEIAEVNYLIDAARRHGDAIGFAAKMNDGVFEASGLDRRTFFLVRLAAMAALGAGSTSWRLQEEMAEMFDIEARDLLGTLVAISPTIGVTRFLEAMDEIVDG